MAEIKVSNPKFFNKSLIEVNFRQRFGLTVVAIRRADGQVVVSPPANEIVCENDNLLVIGSTVNVDNLDEKLND